MKFFEKFILGAITCLLFLPASLQADEYLSVEIDAGAVVAPLDKVCADPFSDFLVYYSSDAGYLISALIEAIKPHIPDESALLGIDSDPDSGPEPQWPCPPGTEPVFDGGNQVACIGPDPDSRGNNTYRICFKTDVGLTICLKVRITCDKDGNCTLRIFGFPGVDVRCTITEEGGKYKVSCKKKKFPWGWEDTGTFYYEWKECSPGVMCLCISDTPDGPQDCHPMDPDSVPFLPDILPLIPGYEAPPTAPECEETHLEVF